MAQEKTYTGKVEVIDGDTFILEATRIRLYGVDAPDVRQTCRWPKLTVRCGVLAGDGLRDLTLGAVVTCVQRSVLADQTVVATCTAEGRDIARNMVHAGWALADVKQSGRYVPVEAKARAANRGLWRGVFVLPWKWRAE